MKTDSRGTTPVKVGSAGLAGLWSQARAWAALFALASALGAAVALAEDAATKPAAAEPAEKAAVALPSPAATAPAAVAGAIPATAAAPAAATVAAVVTAPGAVSVVPPAAATIPAAATAPAAATVQAPFPVVPANAPICLNFNDAPVRSVLEYISESAGMIVVEDVPVEGRITVMSRQNISVEEAVALLDTVLRQKGYAAVRTGRTLKIVTAEQAKKELVPVRTGNDPTKIEATDRIVTQIIPIRYADATKLKADLASLIPATTDVASNVSSNTLIVTGTEATVRRIVEIIQAIDVHMSEVSQVKVFQLKYANASSSARLIMDIFKQDQPAQGAAAMFGGRRGFAAPGQQPSNDDAARAVKVLASADDRTNTLVISAAPDVMVLIEGVVKQLDANPAEQQAVFIYRLKNAQATNLESVLNNIFGSGGSSSSAARQSTSSARGTTGSTFGSGTGSTSGRGLGSSTTQNTARTGGTTQNRGTTGGRGLSAGAAATAAGLAGQVYIVADADTNSLVVTTASNNFDRVKEVIADLDRAVPQVLIKVLIAEVSHDKSLDLGVEFSAMDIGKGGRGSKAGTDFGVGAKTTGFTFNLEERDVTAAVRALSQVATLDVLSRPYILTSDNQQATIMVGQEVPFITNTRTTDTGQTINTIQYDDIGIILNVTPHINPQGLVTLDVAPEISTLTGETVPISETVSAPVFAKRSAQSRVAIRDGQTIVIGGLMEDRNTTSIDKVPILGDIPLLGLLFRHTVEKKTKTELLIFLTPHVALQPDDLKGMSESEKAGAKVIQDAVEKGALDEHLKGMERGGAPSTPAQEPEPPVKRIGPDAAPDSKEPIPDAKQYPAKSDPASKPGAEKAGTEKAGADSTSPQQDSAPDSTADPEAVE